MSDSDDEYDPAEIAVPAPAPTPAVEAAAEKAGPLCRADLFSISASHAAESTLASGLSPAASRNAAAQDAHRDESIDDNYRLLSGIKGRIRCLALNPAGTTLCAGSEDGQLCMWDFNVPLKSHRVAPTRVLTPFVNRISGLQPIIALTFAKDGSFFVACQDGDSPALVRASGEQLGYCAMGERGLLDVVQCRGHRAPVTCAAAHHRDAAVFLTGGQDGTVRLWNHNTFTHRSVYAIKHGSGQLTDTHVVESVTTLQHFRSGQADIFASGGQDGCVQLWDSRVKYRPGGALATVDMFAAASNGNKRVEADVFAEKHVGGLLEMQAASPSSPAASPPDHSLAVRVGSVIKTIDLRKLSSSLGASASAVVQEVASGLPFALDTTCLVLGGRDLSSMLTCTSRAGYQNVTGGHVVQYTYRGGVPPCDRTMIWRAGKPEEDVLCVCADRSRPDGCVYGGLSSGEVVVRNAFTTGKDPQPIEAWLQTRPKREWRDRAPGEKARRADDDAQLLAGLF
ncbi:hypothetical protein ABL78_6463 [Leptomonas seymouri]|uniref:Uncharacterized protein n=1 Tax=Leptomonas seymouri TaxID=5684 RepID=A0A0N1PBT4_LEPSE|nr:hypothetical protein ABL78_6463 [Leptomonas seymouri]|eukprot:KPI84475.1 hypothetical protein ABL78_6463 [Leptomonas seymouri]